MWAINNCLLKENFIYCPLVGEDDCTCEKSYLELEVAPEGIEQICIYWLK